jgi:SNF2 family DNA or RNA helicase
VDALRRELGVFLTYRRKEDELDLPPILTQDIPVTLGKRQRRTYDDMARDAIAFVDGLDGPLTAANGLALLTKLRQIATGLNLVSDLVDSAKLDAAVDIVRDNPDEAFVVFSYFVGAAEALASRLEAVGVKTFTVHQGVKIEDRTDFINRFQAGEGRVFVGTLGTLGESVTLSRASNVLFLDRSWNPELNNQAVDRVAGGFRALQVGRPITITNLVSEGTVDETQVTPTLSSKAAVRAVILGRRNA